MTLGYNSSRYIMVSTGNEKKKISPVSKTETILFLY